MFSEPNVLHLGPDEYLALRKLVVDDDKGVSCHGQHGRDGGKSSKHDHGAHDNAKVSVGNQVIGEQELGIRPVGQNSAHLRIITELASP
eukprot:1359204-Amorphochlora_amoeboformis.AAC.2